MWHYPSRPHFWVPVFMVDDWSAALTYPGSVQDCFFCPCETSKLPAVAGGLPNPQTPNPTTPPPPNPNSKPLPSWKELKHTNGNFQGLSAQERAPTLSSDPHHHPNPSSHPVAPAPSPASNPTGQRAAGRWSAACRRWAESQASRLSPALRLLPSEIFPPSLETRSASECCRVHLYGRQRGREGKVKNYSLWLINCPAAVNSAFKCKDISSRGLWQGH